MKFIDLLKKNPKELCALCAELKMEHMNLRILSKTMQNIKTSAFRVCKKDIARVKTRLTQLKKTKVRRK
ncbi:MAG: 50S ribosomal protein L29 [Holosporales bacterium]|jgi:ribosomal protein L29|nr:50S ribosomal protein L29 [Holosporales bacterium]